MVVPKPEDLISLSREVKADDTMREFQQVLRFDIIDGKPLRAQLLLDRRHKAKKSLSKPAAYVRMSQAGQLIDLACGAITMANILVLQHLKEIPPRQLIEDTVKSALDMMQGDIVTLTEIMLQEIQQHRR